MQRRAFISLLAGPLFATEPGKGHTFPSEFHRYSDPATELDVLRLSSPDHSCVLPAAGQRAIAHHAGFLLHASDRPGSLEAFRLDLRNGESRQLTQSTALDPATLSLSADERSILYFDGPTLRQTSLSAGHDREVYHAAEARTSNLAVSDDGLHAVFAEGGRIRRIGLARGDVTTLAEAPSRVTFVLTRPRRTQALYFRENGAPWLVNFDGQQNRPLKIDPIPGAAPGVVQWAPSGRTLLYLRFPTEPHELNSLREHTPDENADKFLAKTSQFVQFGVNGDGSVFVGASRNKASPNVLLLLRVTRREFTLCEHRASDPKTVAPIFSPTSQTIYFQSDRDGKPAIYRMRVDKLVEETGSQSEL